MSTGSRNQATPGPRVLHLAERGLLIVAIISILAICAIIFFGVITRAVFNWSLPDAEIIVRDLMIASIILPLAYVTAERAHIAVDVFVNLMPPAARPWCNLLGSLVGFLVLLPIAYGGWQGFHTAWNDGNYYYGEFDLPEWPGKFAFFIGYVVFVLRLLTLLVQDALSVLKPTRSKAGPQTKG